MILAALALLSNPAVHTPAVRPAIATMAPQSPFWADDYPHSPRAIPDTITTGIKVTIGANGHVEDCVVTSTSGWPNLDAALCDKYSRARFQPPVRTSGPQHHLFAAPENENIPRLWMPGTYDLNIVWKPPRF